MFSLSVKELKGKKNPEYNRQQQGKSLIQQREADRISQERRAFAGGEESHIPRTQRKRL